MGIMDLFKSAAPAQPAAPTNPNASPGAGNPGSIPNNPANPAPGTGDVPASIPDANKKQESPLDAFSKLWENDPAAAPKPDEFFNVDPKKLQEAAGQLDFKKIITPDQLKAIGEGGEAAVAAFADAINNVSRATYAQSAFAATKITEQALARAEKKFADQLPSMVKKLNLSESLTQENPALSHPAAAPLLQAIQSQLAVKYPNASTAELQEHAKTYLTAFADAANPASKQSQSTDTSKVTEDWDKFFNM